MKKAAKILKVASGVALVALAGCGGSGSPTDTSTGSFQVTLSTAPTLVMTAGAAVQFAGVAKSFPNPMASVTWTSASTNGAPALSLVNADCSTAVKKSQATATAGSVSAEWDCSAGISAPLGLTSNATYALTMNAVDSKGNGSSSTTQVTVTPSSAPAISVSTLPAANLVAGISTQVLGVAVATPKPIVSANWTATATNGGPALSLTNADCAVATKTSQNLAIAGQVKAEWDCYVGVLGPTNIAASATYKLTMTAIDSSGGSFASSTGITAQPSGATPVTISNAQTLTLNAGDNVQFIGVAKSSPQPMSSATWTASTTNGAPALTLTNADCKTSTKTSQALAGMGQVNAEWDCPVGIVAPKNLTSDGTYLLTMVATDASGSSTSAGTVVTAKPTVGVTSSPSVSTSIPSAATSGISVTATCTGSLGYAVNKGMYTYQWVSTPTLPFSGANTATTTFVAPVVTSAQNYQVTCRVTDDNQVTSTASGSIVVSPPVGSTIVPSVKSGGNAISGQNVSLDGSGTTWVDALGKPYSQSIYYNWTQTAGPTVAMYNTATALATATMPLSVAANTAFAFTLNTSDKPFVAGASTGTVSSSADVVYFMTAHPPLTLSTTFAAAVTSSSYVIIPSVATASPASTLPVYYGWTQVSGPAVILGGSTTSTLNFVAPVNLSKVNPIVLLFRVSAGFDPITVATPGTAVLDVVVDVSPAPGP